MTRNVAIAAMLAMLALAYFQPAETPKPSPDAPAPCPGPDCPVPPPLAPPNKPKPRPWGDCPPSPVGELTGAKVGGRIAPDGTPIQIDLPGDRHLKNKGGSDGAGLCVFTSAEHCGDWHDEPAWIGFRDWMTKFPGGGYPSKFDAMVKKRCAALNIPVPNYLNVSGADIGLIEKLLAAGIPVGMTYDHSPTGRYGGGRIAHMVNCVHARGDCFGILDNNYPGADKIEWLTRREFQSVKPDWIVALISDGPPPVPRPAQ